MNATAIAPGLNANITSNCMTFKLLIAVFISCTVCANVVPQSPLRSMSADQLLRMIDQELANKKPDKAAKLYRYFDCFLVDEPVIEHSNKVIAALKKQGVEIIATTDPHREPKSNELVIVYSSYQHAHNNLPYQNKIWRHPIYFKDVSHTRVEYDPAWEPIGIIYIINLLERKDRLLEILAELCMMHAPLDRIHHFLACCEQYTDDRKTNAYLGCGMSHAMVTEHFLNTNLEHALVLEDDVTFSGDIEGNLQRLKLFFDRNYDYEVCLVNSSKFYEMREFDDLLLLSYQKCTTTSGYLVSKKGAVRAHYYFADGFEKYKKTREGKYAVDCYWSEMQKDNKFFVFRTKFGYQRHNYSSITGNTTCFFD